VIIRAPATVIPVGETVQLAVTVGGAPGPTVSAAGAKWSSSAPHVVRVDASGRTVAVGPGVATVTVTIGGRHGTLDLMVVRTAGTLVLGDSATGEVRAGSSPDTIRLALVPGDTIDVGLFGANGLGAPRLVPLDTGPTLPRVLDLAADAIYPAMVVGAGGVYRFGVRSAGTCVPRSGRCEHSGTYTLRVRRSGPVVTMQTLPGTQEHRAVVGTTTWSDTVQLTNFGARAWDVPISRLRGAGWLAIEAPVVSVPGGYTSEAPLRGVATAVVRVNLAGLTAGIYDDSVGFGLPADVWHRSLRRALWFRLRVDEPTEVVSTADAAQVMAVVRGGGLVGWTFQSNTLFRLDPRTGARSPWLELPGGPGGPGGCCLRVLGMWTGPDSALHLAHEQYSRAALYRIEAQGSLTHLLDLTDVGAERSVAILPDGSAYLVGGGSFGRALLHRSPEGRVTVVDSLHVTPERGIAYSARDGWLYYVGHDATLRGYHVRTGLQESRGRPFVPERARLGGVLAVDTTGLLYVLGYDQGATHVVVLEASGRVVERRWPAGDVQGFALLDGYLYGSSLGNPQGTWRLRMRPAPGSARAP
jgi:hypothetical protein